MMTHTDAMELISTLIEQIAPGYDLQQLQGDDNIREEFELDSFDFLKFLVGVSERLQVDIPEADYEKIQTLDSLLAYLQARR